jgi:excinuclease ABC subunit A
MWVDYLIFDISMTLAGGESQRILASKSVQIIWVLYVLDEPSLAYIAFKINWLKKAANLGNTVVAWTAETMESSDLMVEIEYGAGEHGGHIVAVGTWWNNNPASLTGQYLSGKSKLRWPELSE